MKPIKQAAVQSTYYHFEPGDATRYEFIITHAVPGAFRMLTLMKPYWGSAPLPEGSYADIDPAWLARKLFGPTIDYTSQKAYTARKVLEMLESLEREVEEPPMTSQGEELERTGYTSGYFTETDPDGYAAGDAGELVLDAERTVKNRGEL